MQWKTLAPGHLDKLAKAQKSIFVLNTSALPDGSKATIIININDGTRRDFFKMPPTFIPIAVTDMIPINKLLDCRDFRDCLSKGMLTLVDPDQAENYLNTQEAKDEYESLMLSEHSSKNRRQPLETEVAKRVQVAHQSSDAGAGPTQDTTAHDTVSNKVRALVEDMISGSKDEKEVAIQLRRHHEALSHADLSHVVAYAKTNELRDYAQKAMATVGKTSSVNIPAGKKKAVAGSSVNSAKPSAAFDFDSNNNEMTEEEAQADARARAEAMSTQAVNKQSKITEALDEMVRGKK